MIYVSWFIFSIIVALLGDNRKIGVWLAFLISIILSPLIGLIVVLCSDKKEPQRVIVHNPVKPQTSKADEIQKMKELLDAGAITQEEFDGQKNKILNS